MGADEVRTELQPTTNQTTVRRLANATRFTGRLMVWFGFAACAVGLAHLDIRDLVFGSLNIGMGYALVRASAYFAASWEASETMPATALVGLWWLWIGFVIEAVFVVTSFAIHAYLIAAG